MVFRRAFAETTRFWSVHRYLATLAGPTATILYRGLAFGWPTVKNDIPGTVAIGLLGIGISWTVIFVYNLFHSPLLLLKEARDKVAELENKSAQKPEVIARWAYQEMKIWESGEHSGFKLMLQNTGSRVAVNISVSPMELPIPESVRSGWAEESKAMGHKSDLPRVWNVSFSGVDKLSPNEPEQEIPYTISNVSPLQRDIGGVLRACIDWDAKVRFPYTVVFSSVSVADQWHTHYEMEFSLYPSPGKINSRMLGIEPVNTADAKCPICR
jgi:hypothetical protein